MPKVIVASPIVPTPEGLLGHRLPGALPQPGGLPRPARRLLRRVLRRGPGHSPGTVGASRPGPLVRHRAGRGAPGRHPGGPGGPAHQRHRHHDPVRHARFQRLQRRCLPDQVRRGHGHQAARDHLLAHGVARGDQGRRPVDHLGLRAGVPAAVRARAGSSTSWPWATRRRACSGSTSACTGGSLSPAPPC